MYNDFIQRIVEMKAKGIGSRSIARELGISKSSVNYFYKRFLNEAGVAQVAPEHTYNGPKCLVLDIETAPIMAYVWRLFKTNVGLNQIAEDWHIMSFAAKWLHSPYVIYADQRDADNIEDDSELLEQLWDLLDEADVVITQNGVAFDIPKIKSRMVVQGFKPFSPVRHIDLYKITRSTFGFTSNKLAYLSETLCPDNAKSKHEKFPGFELWRECMAGNVEAWDEMETYNVSDITSLEEIYYILAPWANIPLPVFAVYDESTDFTCNCGGSVVSDGFAYTNSSKFERYRCGCCGRYYRGKVNLLTKEKRKSILTNVLV